MSNTSQSLKIVKTIIIVIAINFNGYSQEISKVSEIYDYEIGDIFHSVYWLSAGMSGFSTRFNAEIIDKYYTQANDTLIYVRDVARLHIDISGTTTSYYIDTVYYTDLDSEIYSGNIDSVYSDPDLYNGRLINYYDCYGCFGCTYVEKKWIVGF